MADSVIYVPLPVLDRGHTSYPTANSHQQQLSGTSCSLLPNTPFASCLRVPAAYTPARACPLNTHMLACDA